MSQGTLPIPYWMADRDYYPRTDPRYAAHVRNIDIQRGLNARVDASAGDGSYSVLVTRNDVMGGA
ncbi:hypothetical protein [Bradyrhizobium sp. SZCCHNRI1073]|uniref:hypothetical protein n=1 Tax=Bradyrhizobium sp. SZCCHNRI1073 TaxID=3057280 RepID=UPI002916011E|nr:hypothetical protein [Bradyrhizobium sp. SZCCHNRI1073]